MTKFRQGVWSSDMLLSTCDVGEEGPEGQEDESPLHEVHQGGQGLHKPTPLYPNLP